jgi:predicted dienelactone hydrolase
MRKSLRRKYLAAPAICVLLAFTARAAGVREIAIPADTNGPQISARLWTPCALSPKPIEVNSGGATLIINGVKDCTPASEALPLILISHGMFGDVFSHHDTAEALADGGFAVLALNHTQDSISATRESVDNLSSFIVRPVDIKRAIDFLLSGSQKFASIDSGRIGFFGFSRGGYTGLVLAGAVPDFRAPAFECPDEFVMCKQIHEGDIREHMPSDEPRIKAFVIADPVSFFPNRESLQRATAPIQLWSSEQGGMGVRPEDVALVRENLPHAPDFRRPAGSAHLSFQFPCSSDVTKAMPFICTDPPDFDRASFHRTFNAEVLQFFREQLVAASPP